MRIYGKRAVNEFLNNNKKIYKVYLYPGFKDEKIILDLQKRKIKPEYLSKIELDKIEKGNHQGIILETDEYQYLSFEDLINQLPEKPFLIILDHIEDPHNLGAIIRTCEAAAVDGIIIPKDRSANINSTVMKVSSGALSNISICRVTNINNTIKDLKNNGIWIIGTDAETKIDYAAADYDLPLALIIGNEGKGLSHLTKKLCDIKVSIPMRGKINSLNASVAAGILVYKVIEKRGCL